MDNWYLDNKRTHRGTTPIRPDADGSRIQYARRGDNLIGVTVSPWHDLASFDCNFQTPFVVSLTLARPVRVDYTSMWNALKLLLY